MSLFQVLLIGFLARASAYARASITASGEELAFQTFKEFIDARKAATPTYGATQLVGECCGDYSGAAADVDQSINTNTLYGSLQSVTHKVFHESGCSAITEEKFDAHGKSGCKYFFIFANAAHAEHAFAANCVPAQVCKDNVVGMTQGKIFTYGAVLQILQQNLGDLEWLGVGNTSSCYEGMHKINGGHIQDLFKQVKIKGLGLLDLLDLSKEELHIPGMEKVTVEESFGDCQDDPQIGYLFIHKNLYWSGDKSAVDLEAFTKMREEKAAMKAQSQKELILSELAAAHAKANAEKEAAADRGLTDVVV